MSVSLERVISEKDLSTLKCSVDYFQPHHDSRNAAWHLVGYLQPHTLQGDAPLVFSGFLSFTRSIHSHMYKLKEIETLDPLSHEGSQSAKC